ncbi:MAG: PLP-dependent transferase [Patescibacteria group bacterium]
MADSVAQSFADLHDDCAELLWIIEDRSERIAALRSKRRKHILPETSATLLDQEKSLLLVYTECANDLRGLLNVHDEDRLLECLRVRDRVADTVRSLQGISGALLAASGWQSPSFLAAKHSQAGLETGTITGTINDYKRDQHWDELRYEQAFVKEYVDSPLRLTPFAFVTASGMAAFTTIVATLLDDPTCKGPVLIGASSYFENIQIAQLYFPGRVIFVDEMNAEAILEAIRVHKPSVLFLDTMCNAVTMAVPDLSALIPRIVQVLDAPLTLVIDATGTSVTHQILKDVPLLNIKLHIIVFESLLKFHQYGMDRVSGGIMWRTAMSPFPLFGRRMHIGTNLVDASVLSLPWPNRSVLERRLRRHHRNTTMIATAFDVHTGSDRRTALERVVYPGLPSHPAYSWMKDRDFHGAFFVIVLKERYRKAATYMRFLEYAVEEARNRGVELIAGSSFGLSKTRVYLTALRATGTTEPFLRVSAGTETVIEVEKIISALTRALERLA